MIKDPNYLVKLILIGSSGVGKTSVLTKFADDKFSDTFLTTIGVDFRFKTINYDNNKIAKFQIWDTAGQQRFRTITSAYYKGADGIIMVYDVTDPTSLQDIQNFWIPQALSYCDKSIDMMLLGNKSDFPATVSESKVKALLDKHHFSYAVVSAKSGDKIYQSIHDFGFGIIKKKFEINNPNSIGTPGSNYSNSTSTMSSNSLKQVTSTPGVHIENKKEYNLKYSKGCC